MIITFPFFQLKVPLLLDDERFSDVLVNPTMIREAEVKCKSAKVPERYLLNKVLELVFTAEEFTAARGTKSLNQHKQEAVKGTHGLLLVYGKCGLRNSYT